MLFDFTEIKIEFISHKGPLLRVPNVVVIKLNSMHHAWVLSEVSLNKELNSFDVAITCENTEILIFPDKEIF